MAKISMAAVAEESFNMVLLAEEATHSLLECY
jgi:hypothetical protein